MEFNAFLIDVSLVADLRRNGEYHLLEKVMRDPESDAKPVSRPTRSETLALAALAEGELDGFVEGRSSQSLGTSHYHHHISTTIKRTSQPEQQY